MSNVATNAIFTCVPKEKPVSFILGSNEYACMYTSFVLQNPKYMYHLANNVAFHNVKAHVKLLADSPRLTLMYEAHNSFQQNMILCCSLGFESPALTHCIQFVVWFWTWNWSQNVYTMYAWKKLHKFIYSLLIICCSLEKNPRCPTEPEQRIFCTR